MDAPDRWQPLLSQVTVGQTRDTLNSSQNLVSLLGLHGAPGAHSLRFKPWCGKVSPNWLQSTLQLQLLLLPSTNPVLSVQSSMFLECFWPTNTFVPLHTQFPLCEMSPFFLPPNKLLFSLHKLAQSHLLCESRTRISV